MPEHTPRHIVIGANAHAELHAIIAAARPDLQIRGNRYTEITNDDLSWGDTYIGFRRPPLETMRNIRWVHCTGAGVDAWLLPTELSRTIMLTRSSESFGPAIAEWTLSRALTIAQHIVPLNDAQRSHTWSPRETVPLRGAKVLVVGTGDVGTHVGRLFAALGCHVTGVSRSGTGDGAVFHRLARVNQLAGLVGEHDWILLMTPLTHDTRHLFDRAMLSRCRGAVLINAGRGAVIDEAVLPHALDAGWIRAAALDVFETEPLPEHSPLWNDPRVIVSPHMSGLTTNAGAAAGFLECLASIERGEQPIWLVDRERGY